MIKKSSIKFVIEKQVSKEVYFAGGKKCQCAEHF